METTINSTTHHFKSKAIQPTVVLHQAKAIHQTALAYRFITPVNGLLRQIERMALAGLVHVRADTIQDARRLSVWISVVVVRRIDALPLRLGQCQDLVGASNVSWVHGHEGLTMWCQKNCRRGFHGEIKRVMNHRLERETFHLVICSFGSTTYAESGDGVRSTGSIRFDLFTSEREMEEWISKSLEIREEREMSVICGSFFNLGNRIRMRNDCDLSSSQ